MAIPKLRKREAGLSLIEVLIATAVLIIVLYITYRVFISGSEMICGSDRRLDAISLSRVQMEEISHTPLDRLPPENLRASTDIVWHSSHAFVLVELSHEGVVREGLHIYLQGKEIPADRYLIDENTVCVYLDTLYAGKEVTVDYTYHLRIRCENVRIPSQPPYRVRLLDIPVDNTVRLRAEHGDVPTIRMVDEDTGAVWFHERDAARMVMIEYQSKGFETLVSGRSISSEAEMGDPSIKEITLVQLWHEQNGKRRMQLSCIRTR